MKLYAHSRRADESEWHDLRQHLDDVAATARDFAEAFGAGEWGRLAGLWHDLGKHSLAFQEYIRGQRKGARHKIAGALLAKMTAEGRGHAWRVLAMVIAGHHSGMPDRSSGGEAGTTKLDVLLRDPEELAVFNATLPHAPEDLQRLELPTLPERLRVPPKGRSAQDAWNRSLELFTRFLFSALVDADYLDTEKFCRPRDYQDRAKTGFDDLPDLRDKVDAHIESLASDAKLTDVNELRAEVLAACRRAAEMEPGFFSLTVPTGGGKTLSAMSFALRHAIRNGQRRVIAVIPFTSIIEQNAAVYRESLGDRNVIEHHSALDPEKEDRRNKLASENWDAPVVVTTAVQFFESLFANKPARCRKLHNVAGSVVLLDEVQTLPTNHQMPLLDGLRELVEHFGVTVVLSTATQPAFRHDPQHFQHGLPDVREIIPDPSDLCLRLKRYQVSLPDPDAPATSWNQLASDLAHHHRVLAIVHRRDDARELATLLPEEGRFHLSALMCAAHRSTVLDLVKERLKTDQPCRLVATQLIEAGVDIDFPVVYRALGGLDSIVQAGGRCNREGSPEKGRLVVFRAPSEPPQGTPARGLKVMERLLCRHGREIEILDPVYVEEYFRRCYMVEPPDASGVQPARARHLFATVARRIRLIDDYAIPVVVPYGDGPERLERYRADPRDRDRLRALQPYTVGATSSMLKELEQLGAVEHVHDTVRILKPAPGYRYDDAFGLILDSQTTSKPE